MEQKIFFGKDPNKSDYVSIPLSKFGEIEKIYFPRNTTWEELEKAIFCHLGFDFRVWSISLIEKEKKKFLSREDVVAFLINDKNEILLIEPHAGGGGL